jgi:PAS domain S-box-containing protein
MRMKGEKDTTRQPAKKKKQEDLYRSLYENTHDGIYQSSLEGKIISANPALINMLGYESEEELKKMNIARDIYVQSAARDSFVKEVERKGRLRDIEIMLKRKDGSHIIVLENSHAVRNNKGDIIYYEGTLTEITERKRAEEALRESENRYHTLIETLQDGISLFDLNGKLKYFNQQKKNMLGYDNDDELMQINAFQLIHPDDQQLVKRIFAELMSMGSIGQKELRVMRKDGNWFWAEFSATIIKDINGNPILAMDTMRDISQRKHSEEQLMLLKHSVDVHYDGAYWMDTDNRFVYVNDAGCKASGYSREELTGKHVSFINPQASEQVMRLIWEKLRKDGSFTAESFHLRKDGSKYPVELVSTYVKFGGKEYNCGFARDINDRKKAAEEMRIHIEQLRQIIDLVPSYIFAKDIDGKFLLANKALADVFGLSPDEIQGKNDSDYGASKEQVEWYRKADLKVIGKGITVQIPEEQVLRKDGTLGWFQTVKIPYNHPGYDKPAILGVATEITERKEVEDELRKSEKRFRELFESHSAVKLIIDPETGSIIDANNAASEYYGWPVSKLRKMNIGEINTDPEDELRARLDKAKRSKSIHFETAHRLEDGSLRAVEVFSSKIEIEGKFYLHSIIHDITEKKKILADLIAAKEKAEGSDRLKTAFLHNISHEIRTPMNAIVGFTSLLETSGLSDETRRQYIDIIFQSSNQLLSIISDIVDISNIETGHVKVSLNEVNINSLIRNIYDQFYLKAEQMGLKFKTHTALENGKAEIMTDETRLMQVISNLLNNSFKFTNKGSIDFGYTLKGETIEFFVKDTGIGIRPENYQKIFERFYQVENTTNNKTEGTGLGLSICKAYIELMGGKIWIVSKPGKGSDFYFTIPLYTGKKHHLKKKKGGNTGRNGITTGKLILVAEDDEISFRLIREFVSGLEVNVLRAVNGKEAVDICRKTDRIDLVLMDIKMPEMDGFQALSLIKEFRQDLPVIAVTAWAQDSDKEKALSSGFSGYIPKPIIKSHLLRIVKAYLKY